MSVSRLELTGEGSIPPKATAIFAGELPPSFRIRRLTIEGDRNGEAFVTQIRVNDRVQYRNMPPAYPGLPVSVMNEGSPFYHSFAPTFGMHKAGDRVSVEIANPSEDAPLLLKVFLEG